MKRKRVCRGRSTGEFALAIGVVLVVIGAIFLLESLDVIDAGINELWPLILIAIGLVIVYGRVRRQYRRR